MTCICWTAGGNQYSYGIHDIFTLQSLFREFKQASGTIFEYYEDLALHSKLPSYEDIEADAKILCRLYTSAEAQYEALSDARDGSNHWTSRIALGTPWVPPPFNPTSVSRKSKSRKTSKTSKAKKDPKPPPPFFGDRVAHDLNAFNMDIANSREACAAAAQGEIGRFWEALKVR